MFLRYFGAAKNLAGVKEKLERKPTEKRKKNLYDYNNRNIDAKYYGFTEDEDLSGEKEAETIGIKIFPRWGIIGCSDQ